MLIRESRQDKQDAEGAAFQNMFAAFHSNCAYKMGNAKSTGSKKRGTERAKPSEASAERETGLIGMVA